jgi:tetratricopeptide (TPR) repeat protein
MEIADDYSSGMVHLASLLRVSENEEERIEALDIYTQCVEKWRYWFEPRRRAAEMLEERGKEEEACNLLLEGIVHSQDEPDVLVRDLTDILREAGRDAEAIQYAERFARERPTVNMLGVWFDVLEQTESEQRGIEEARKFYEGNPKSPYGCVRYATWLIGSEQDEEAEKLLRQAVEGAPTYVWARKKLMDLLSVDRPEEAVEIASRASEPDAWLQVEWAGIENDLGRHQKALELLKTAIQLPSDPGWRLQEQWNLALLGQDEPESVLDRLTGDDEDDLHALRARMFLASGIGRFDVALEILKRIPEDDNLSRVFLMRAADGSDMFRPHLEERFRKFVGKPSTAYTSRRWAQAILLGNAAAMGHREPFDSYLDTERNIRHLGNVLSTLNIHRQPELSLAVRKAIAGKEVEVSRVYMERAHLAAYSSDHDTAIKTMRECLRRWPRNSGAWTFLAAELLLAGDGAGHEAIDRTLRIPKSWVWRDEVMAISKLLRGKRDEARKWAQRARRRWVANGFTLDEHSFLQATLAVLRGDRQAVMKASRIHGSHYDPDSPMWERLTKEM